LECAGTDRTASSLPTALTLPDFWRSFLSVRPSCSAGKSRHGGGPSRLMPELLHRLGRLCFRSSRQFSLSALERAGPPLPQLQCWCGKSCPRWCNQFGHWRAPTRRTNIVSGGAGGGGRKTELETLKEVGSQGGAIIRASTILDASLMSSAFSSPPLSLRPSMLEAHASLWFQSRVAASGRLPQVLCLLLSRASPVPLWPKLALPCDSSLALLVLGASSKSSVFSSSLCLLRPSMIKADARNSLRPPAGCRP